MTSFRFAIGPKRIKRLNKNRRFNITEIYRDYNARMNQTPR